MRTAQRDEQFTAYVAARWQHLRRFAYLLCGDWHKAEDLVQNALTKLYVAWPRIRHQGAEEAYARRTILRCHLDESRRPWRRELTYAEVPDVMEPVDSSHENADEIYAAIRALPPKQRAAVVLRYWLDLSSAEAAADIGCSISTVNSHVSRGVKRLRAVLSHAHEKRTNHV